MCSCVAKVTAPPPPTVSLSHTHMQTHTRTVLNHFDFAKCGRNFGECSSPHGQTGKETSKCSSVSGKRTHLCTHLCRCHAAAFTFCKRFTVPDSDSLTAMQPRCQSRARAQLPHTDRQTNLSQEPHQFTCLSPFYQVSHSASR